MKITNKATEVILKQLKKHSYTESDNKLVLVIYQYAVRS
jgi:hypothetical protein